MENKREVIGEIYNEIGILHLLLRQTIDKWLHVKRLVNQYNYYNNQELDQVSERIETLDTLWSVEQEIKETLNYLFQLSIKTM